MTTTPIRLKEEVSGKYAELIGQEHRLGTLYETWRAKAEKLELQNTRYREALESIERRAGSASIQSGYADATEAAEWARQALKGDA